MDIDYEECIHWEMSPDIYAGESCEEIKPRWEGYAEGDKQAGFDDEIILKPEQFPPGTKVVVSLPYCPECGMDADSCKVIESCDFDWDLWVESRYS